MRSFLLALAFCTVSINAETWVVLVAGSNGWHNYRHQADVCHAYHVVRDNGVPPENIIVLAYDDIANNTRNPFPGQIFNKPTPVGVKGRDVYAGCKIDYSGRDVTASNFMNILTGNEQAMKGIGNGKVLKSGQHDNVFIFYSDHGAAGVVEFPVGPSLTVSTLNAGLKDMYARKMYNKLVFYLEACLSGSMFHNALPTNINVYATSAADPYESSWGTYCPPDDRVDGKPIGTCLGDEYSVHWMEHADRAGPSPTLLEQFETVRNLTRKSKVMQWGDTSFTAMAIGEFQGNYNFSDGQPAPRRERPGRHHRLHDRPHSGWHKTMDRPRRPSHLVSSRDIVMHTLYYRYLRAGAEQPYERMQIGTELLQEVEHRIFSDQLFLHMAKTVSGEEGHLKVFNAQAVDPSLCGQCCDDFTQVYTELCGGWTDYSLQYFRVVHNLCAATQKQPGALLDVLKFSCPARK